MSSFQLSLQNTGMGLEEKVEHAIALLRMYHPPLGVYWGAFSGGKDSVVIKSLVEAAGVPVAWNYNVTTVDPPELVRFIMAEHPDVKFLHPEKPLWAMIPVKQFPPTRRMRWCCEIYKERSTPHGSYLILGVRKAESPRRAARWSYVNSYKAPGGALIRAICPIVDWSDSDIWEYIRTHKLSYCGLYDEGFKRLGCVGCPMSSRRLQDFERWPRIAALWRKGIDAAWEYQKSKPGTKWTSSEDFWKWWVEEIPPSGEECDGLGLFM